MRNYVQQQLALQQSRLNHYVQNGEGALYPSRSAKRLLDHYIDRFQQSGEARRWILVPGLPGTGKTTLLAQLGAWVCKAKMFRMEAGTSGLQTLPMKYVLGAGLNHQMT